MIIQPIPNPPNSSPIKTLFLQFREQGVVEDSVRRKEEQRGPLSHGPQTPFLILLNLRRGVGRRFRSEGGKVSLQGWRGSCFSFCLRFSPFCSNFNWQQINFAQVKSVLHMIVVGKWPVLINPQVFPYFSLLWCQPTTANNYFLHETPEKIPLLFRYRGGNTSFFLLFREIHGHLPTLSFINALQKWQQAKIPSLAKPPKSCRFVLLYRELSEVISYFFFLHTIISHSEKFPTFFAITEICEHVSLKECGFYAIQWWKSNVSAFILLIWATLKLTT